MVGNNFIARDLRGASTSLSQGSNSKFQPKRLKSTKRKLPQDRARIDKENDFNPGKTVEDLLALGLTDAPKRASQRLRTQRLLTKQEEESKEQIRALELQVKNEKRKGLRAKTSARAIRAYVDHKAGRLSAEQTELHEKARRRKIMEALNSDVRTNNYAKLPSRKGSLSSSKIEKQAIVKLDERATAGNARKPPVPRLSGHRRKRRVKRTTTIVAQNAKPPLPSFPRSRNTPKLQRTSGIGSGGGRKAYKEDQVRAYMAQKRRKALLAKKKLERQREELLRKRARQLEELERRSSDVSSRFSKPKPSLSKPSKAIRHAQQGKPTAVLLKDFQKKQQHAKIAVLKTTQDGPPRTAISSIRLSASGRCGEQTGGLDLLEDIEAVMNRQLHSSDCAAASVASDEAHKTPEGANAVVDETESTRCTLSGEAPPSGPATEIASLPIQEEALDNREETPSQVELADEATTSPESLKAHARLEADMVEMIRELSEKTELVLEKTIDDSARADPGIGNSLRSYELKRNIKPVGVPEVSCEEARSKLKSEVDRISQEVLARAVAEDTLGDIPDSTSILNCKPELPRSNRLEQWRKKASNDPFSLISLLAEEERIKAKLKLVEESSNQSSMQEEERNIEARSEASPHGSIQLTSDYSDEFSRDDSQDEKSFRSISPVNQRAVPGSQQRLIGDHELQGMTSSIGLQTEQVGEEDHKIRPRRLRQRVAKQESESRALLSPNNLKQKLLASVNYLESLEDTDKQLSALEHAQQLALSQQETVAVVERWKRQEQIADNAARMAKLSREYATRFDNTVRQVQEDVTAAATEEVKRAKAQAAALAKQLETERKRTSIVQTDELQTVERGTMNDAEMLPRDIGVMTDRSTELQQNQNRHEPSDHYSVDDFDSGFSSEARTRLSQSILSEILPPDEVRQSRDEEFLNPNNRSDHTSLRTRTVCSSETGEAESYCSTPRSASLLSPSRYSSDGFVNLDSRMDESNISARCLSPTESLRSVVPDEAFLREQTEDEPEDFLECSGGGSFRKFATDLLTNYSRDVEVKRKHDLQILRMREKALKDKTREQLKWLVRQRDRALATKKKRARSPHSSPKSEDTRMPTQREIEKRLEAERRKITFSFKAGKATIEAEKAALNESFYKEKIRLRKHAKMFNKLQNEITLYKKDVVTDVHDGLFVDLMGDKKKRYVRDFLDRSPDNLSVEEDVLESHSLKSTPTAGSIKTLSFASSIKSRQVETSYEKDSFLSGQDGDGLDESSFKEKIEQRDKEIAQMKEEIALKNDEIAKLKAAESFEGMLSHRDGLSACSSDGGGSCPSSSQAQDEYQESPPEKSLKVNGKEGSANKPDGEVAKASDDVAVIRTNIADDSFASTLPSIEVDENHSGKELAEDSFASTNSSLTQTGKQNGGGVVTVGTCHDEKAAEKKLVSHEIREEKRGPEADPKKSVSPAEEVVLPEVKAESVNEDGELKLQRRKELTDKLTEEMMQELVDESVRLPKSPHKTGAMTQAIEPDARGDEEVKEESKESAPIESKNEEPVVRGEVYYDWTEYIKNYIDEVFSYVELNGGLQYKEDDCVESEEKSSIKKKTDAISLKTYIEIERAASRPEHLQIINKSIFDAMCEALVFNFPSEFCHIRESTLVRKSLSCFLLQCRRKPSTKLMRELSKWPIDV